METRPRSGHAPTFYLLLITYLLLTYYLLLTTHYRHHLDETLNTLQYASRAKNIQNRPVVQLDAQVSQYPTPNPNPNPNQWCSSTPRHVHARLNVHCVRTLHVCMPD